MVTGHSFAVDRDRPGMDWRASLAVVLVHVLFLSWLLRSPLSEPIRATLAPLVMVELWTGGAADDPPAPVIDKALTTKAAPSRVRKAALAPAAGSPHPHEQIVVAEGNTAANATAAGVSLQDTALPSASVEGNGSGIAAAQGSRAGTGSRFHPPRVLARTKLSYPADAYRADKQGGVAVMVTVGVNGRVIETHVHESSGSASLDRAAVDAVAHWTFKSAEREGHPTEAQAIVNIDWHIGAATHLTFGAVALPLVGSKTVQSRGCLIANAAHPELCTAPNSAH
ncbi:MAG: energy transducer TonB [Dokdonella sp.]